VTLNDIVSFGGVYDADGIGVEGYQILANNDNEIDIVGTVKGIDTSLDLNAPVGTINASNDDIDIFGRVTTGITTGNGNDDIDIHGGDVDGNIVMGDRASGAAGTNNLYIEAEAVPFVPVVAALILGGAATVGGNVTMETKTTNRLAMEGWVSTDFTDMETPETVYRATIGGNVLMNAYEGATGGILGTNTVLLGDGFHESATTIVGSVTMNAGAGNTMTVDTGWLYDFDQATSVAFASYNAASYVWQNVAMKTEGDNTLEVEHGTFVIGFTGAGDGLSMRQDLNLIGSTGGDNLIDVDDEARLVMYSDVRMGNTIVDVEGGIYNYFNVTIDASTNVETYHFVWSVDISQTVFDTAENTINVEGKMYASDIVMYADDNDIFLTGPAMAPWTVVTAADAGIMTSPGVTGAIMDVEDITMNGLTNTIRVEGTTGDAFFSSDDIVMRWGVTLGAPVAARTNIITNDDDSLFNSGNIAMYATISNTLRVNGLEVDGVYTKSNVGVTGNAGVGVTMATIGTTNGANLAVFTNTDVHGHIVMDVSGSSGSNDLSLIGFTSAMESDIYGNVNMTTGVTAGGNGNNTFGITYGNVHGNVIMDANGLAGGNLLTVRGGITFTSDITGGVNMDSAHGTNLLGFNRATVGAGVTMTAALGLNIAIIEDSVITGPIYQSAAISNFLWIDPSTVNGSVGMTAGIANTFVLDDSTVVGSVSMFANEIGNIFGMIDSGITAGNVTMTSTKGGNTFGFGTDGAQYAAVGAESYPVLPSNGFSHIYGNVSMSAGISGASGGDNIMGQFGTINGSVVMGATADGDNELGIGGSASGGVTLTSVITNGLSMTTVTGDNTLVVAPYASISGGVTMWTGTGTGVTGHSDLRVYATSSIEGGIVTGNGNDDFLIGGSVTGGLSSGIGDDDLTVCAGATVGGDINMGAGDNHIILDGGLMPFNGTGATFTFSDINTDGATGTVGITGTVGTQTMIISDGFGTVGSTMTVDSSVETIVFNELNTKVYGTLNTENGTPGVTGTINVFDVSGATFGTLIDANNMQNSWDLMETGGLTGAIEIFANDGMTGGSEVLLVDNYIGLDLDSWSHNGVVLNIVGDSSLTLTWNGTAYTGTDPEGAGSGFRTWTLDDASTKTELKLSVAYTANA